MMKNMTRQIVQSDQRGIVMLLSLLVLAAITAVAIGMAVIIINDVKAASNVDRSLLAYYAAETGIEKGLDTVKQARIDDSELEATLAALQAAEGTLDNGTHWDTSETETNQLYILNFLGENQSVILDLYDPTAVPLAGAGVESFSIEALDANPEANTAWIEASYFPWSIEAGGTVNWDDSIVTKRIFSIDETRPGAPYLFLDPIEAGKNYRIRVKALYDDLKNVRVTAYAERDPTGCSPPFSGCVKNIPNRVYLDARGKSGGNEIAITASVPWQAPAAAIFDFVLFSDQAIDKRT